MIGNIKNADQVKDAMAWFFRGGDHEAMASHIVPCIHVVLIGKSFRRKNAVQVILSIPEENYNNFLANYWPEQARRGGLPVIDGDYLDFVRDQLEGAFKGVWPELDVASFDLVVEHQHAESEEATKRVRQKDSPDVGNLSSAEETGLNNGWFRTETTISHDNLRFRSKSEIAIYDELKKRQLLFFPNGAAVIGGEKAAKKEPDFLVCDAGKWGILEVMGSPYHTADNAVKDHDRARLFKDFGILCIEFFDAKDCRNNPVKVVDKFLAVLAKH